MTATTQAVILARGLGTRMQRDDDSRESAALTAEQRASAAAGQKGMMNVGRPFIEYVVSSLADAGITRVILVVAPGPNPLREHFTATAPPRRVTVAFAEQLEPRGTADALYAARDAVDRSAFLMLNSDNLYPTKACHRLAAIGGNGLVAFEADSLVREGGIAAEKVLRFALVDIGPDDTMHTIVEKPAPDHPLARRTERWVSMNLWSFTDVIFSACRSVTPSARGELELVDAVRIAKDEMGATFHVIRERAGVLDLSARADVGAVAQRLRGVTPRP